MTFCVLDSSAAISMVVIDESTESTRKLYADIARDRALVPSIFHLEVGNALLMSERRKRIGPKERARAIAALEKLQLDVDPLTFRSAWRATSRLAEANRLTLYDASYLELALRLRLPLATFDADLLNAASQTGATLLQI